VAFFSAHSTTAFVQHNFSIFVQNGVGGIKYITSFIIGNFNVFAIGVL